MVAVMGTLKTEPARSRPDLLAAPVRAALDAVFDPSTVDEILVAPIDPDLADTAAFCAAYEIGLDVSANCVVVAGKPGLRRVSPDDGLVSCKLCDPYAETPAS